MWSNNVVLLYVQCVCVSSNVTFIHVDVDGRVVNIMANPYHSPHPKRGQNSTFSLGLSRDPNLVPAKFHVNYGAGQ